MTTAKKAAKKASTTKKSSAKKAPTVRRGKVCIPLTADQAHAVAHDLGVIINIASSGELASATGAAVVDSRGRLRSLMEALRKASR